MVSIIIPIYNAEKYLEKCLLSVQEQTYKDIEVLCIDDGSTDRSKDIIRNFQVKDKRFIYIRKEHSNGGEARNMGLVAAKGEFLLFVDSDDFLDANTIYNAMIYAMATNADITVFQYKLFYSKLNRSSAKTYGIHTKRRKPFNLFEMGSDKFTFTNIAVWNKLYKKEFIVRNNIEFKSYPAINDVYFSWSSLMCAKKITLCRCMGTYYRVNTGCSVSDNLVRTSEYFVNAFMEVNNLIKEKGMWDMLGKDIIIAEKKQAEEFLDRLRREPELNKYMEEFERHLVNIYY